MEEKPAAVAANKVDALADRGRLSRLEVAARLMGVPFFAVSSATGEGCREMVQELYRLLSTDRKEPWIPSDSADKAEKRV
jgi:50S ribosomal subunit-associated GTPase HflX